MLQITACFLRTVLFMEETMAHIDLIEYWKHNAVKSDSAKFPNNVQWL